MHHQRCAAGMRDPELRVEIGIARMQRLRCQHGRVLANLELHARIGSKTRDGTERVENAVLVLRVERLQRDRFRCHRGGLGEQSGCLRRGSLEAASSQQCE